MMFQSDTSRRHQARWPSTAILLTLMGLAAAPPALLMVMQREAHQPTPYLTINVGQPAATEGTLRTRP